MSLPYYTPREAESLTSCQRRHTCICKLEQRLDGNVAFYLLDPKCTNCWSDGRRRRRGAEDIQMRKASSICCFILTLTSTDAHSDLPVLFYLIIVNRHASTSLLQPSVQVSCKAQDGLQHVLRLGTIPYHALKTSTKSSMPPADHCSTTYLDIPLCIAQVTSLRSTRCLSEDADAKVRRPSVPA